jgi:hypothetical protein
LAFFISTSLNNFLKSKSITKTVEFPEHLFVVGVPDTLLKNDSTRLDCKTKIRSTNSRSESVNDTEEVLRVLLNNDMPSGVRNPFEINRPDKKDALSVVFALASAFMFKCNKSVTPLEITTPKKAELTVWAFTALLQVVHVHDHIQMLHCRFRSVGSAESTNGFVGKVVVEKQCVFTTLAHPNIPNVFILFMCINQSNPRSIVLTITLVLQWESFFKGILIKMRPVTMSNVP